MSDPEILLLGERISIIEAKQHFHTYLLLELSLLLISKNLVTKSDYESALNLAKNKTIHEKIKGEARNNIEKIFDLFENDLYFVDLQKEIDIIRDKQKEKFKKI